MGLGPSGLGRGPGCSGILSEGCRDWWERAQWGAAWDPKRLPGGSCEQLETLQVSEGAPGAPCLGRWGRAVGPGLWLRGVLPAPPPPRPSPSPACASGRRRGPAPVAGQGDVGAVARGGVSSSAARWRENKSRDLEAAATPRAASAEAARLMNLEQIHGRV